ncbi:sigma-70 family RNA polymerase sigma factor [Citricoccus sp. SGAir0253]|uniref:RNA polymerase sigma factor n=1 Tax=Citricoccus sp. SGAir0253 TaxID=2567881 RepID=UPI0010CD30B0|nr:sigma-70 family RNA polymerase sigma factor [Citricoccus sp. SGAir0253]QCU77996.1 sigma-70 family RNA polymerase sigma factor [Citricoccus sp. SGAir0253]
MTDPIEKATDVLGGDELAMAVARVRPVIVKQLGDMGSPGDVEDVAQATWESAWNARHRFDPSKGSLHSWVVTIARRRAIDRVRAQQRDTVLQGQAEHAAEARVQSAVTLTAPDHAEATVDALAAQQRVRRVLGVVEQVMQNREATSRALALVLVFGDDVALAARGLGVSAEVLRQSRRELIRCCQVVTRAQDAAAAGAPVTMRTLIECLPADGESGDWARQMALACAQAGGRFEAVTVAHVMDVTGFSHNTARQYLAQTRHLLQVAMTVLTEERKTRH